MHTVSDEHYPPQAIGGENPPENVVVPVKLGRAAVSEVGEGRQAGVDCLNEGLC